MLKINKNSINELFPTEKKGCFELLSNYQPAGDQKRAISELIAKHAKKRIKHELNYE